MGIRAEILKVLLMFGKQRKRYKKYDEEIFVLFVPRTNRTFLCKLVINVRSSDNLKVN